MTKKLTAEERSAVHHELTNKFIELGNEYAEKYEMANIAGDALCDAFVSFFISIMSGGGYFDRPIKEQMMLASVDACNMHFKKYIENIKRDDLVGPEEKDTGV